MEIKALRGAHAEFWKFSHDGVNAGFGFASVGGEEVPLGQRKSLGFFAVKRHFQFNVQTVCFIPAVKHNVPKIVHHPHFRLARRRELQHRLVVKRVVKKHFADQNIV